MLLQKFRSDVLDSFLDLVWQQWSSLGVSGYGEYSDSKVIDPESLLLFSASIARYDQRLFDEILDWLVTNGRFINVQRLKTILYEEEYQSSEVIRAIAGELTVRSKSDLKWRKLAELKNPKQETTNLFFLKNGNPLPVGEKKDENFLNYGFIRNPVVYRGLSRPFPKRKVNSMLLQLRGLMGVNSRSEILLYLLVNKKGTIQEIADQNYYSWKSVQEVLFEMGHSAAIQFPAAKRGREYYIHAEPWLDLLLSSPQPVIQWICWPALFRSFEILFSKLQAPGFTDFSPLAQAAELKMLMDTKLNQKFMKAGFGSDLGRLAGVWGEEYLEIWGRFLMDLLSKVMQ